VTDHAFEHGAQCHSGESCPVFWLYKPRSAEQKRHHPSPIALRAVATPNNSIALRITCFGRHAVASLPLLQRALSETVTDVESSDSMATHLPPRFEGDNSGQLHEFTSPPTRLEFLTLSFNTPCQLTALDLAAVTGQAAHDMAQWALHDSGDAKSLGKLGCDAAAEQVRHRAAAAIRALQIDISDTSFTRLAMRRSRSNDGQFPLEGFLARLQLRGPLHDAYPWLALLALRGAARHKSLGMGQIALDGPHIGAHLRDAT